MNKVIVKRGRARPLWCGHPWLMSGAVERVDGDPVAGDLVRVVDHEERVIGDGIWNGVSQISVRLLTRGASAGDLATIVTEHIARAVALRVTCGFPSPDTTGFRLVNSEGDRLPGLVVDLFGDTVVAQFTTVGLWRVRDLVARALTPYARRIIEVVTPEAAKREGIEGPLREAIGEGATPDERVPFLELGLRLVADVARGQKTGYYFDQRDARAVVASLARGQRVLDLFSYSGGFGLHAARAGALAVTSVDSSRGAHELGRANAAQNELTSIDWVEDDALRYLIERGRAGTTYGIVIVDPPKLASRDADVKGALERYRRLNAEAMRVVENGGWLLSCTCSAAISRDAFERAIAEATGDADVSAQIVWQGGPGRDHPVSAGHTEGAYLKSVLLRITR